MIRFGKVTGVKVFYLVCFVIACLVLYIEESPILRFKSKFNSYRLTIR